MSELFHSTDYGLSYSQINFTKMQAFNVSTYEFTNDANIAYSNFNDGNSGYPVKTTDGGNTWTQMNAYNVGTYGQVTSMKANYNNPQQLQRSYSDYHRHSIPHRKYPKGGRFALKQLAG
jgi:photosystem II stability/assembly factor-like uncharacterized protein